MHSLSSTATARASQEEARCLTASVRASSTARVPPRERLTSSEQGKGAPPCLCAVDACGAPGGGASPLGAVPQVGRASHLPQRTAQRLTSSKAKVAPSGLKAHPRSWCLGPRRYVHRRSMSDQMVVRTCTPTSAAPHQGCLTEALHQSTLREAPHQALCRRLRGKPHTARRSSRAPTQQRVACGCAHLELSQEQDAEPVWRPHGVAHLRRVAAKLRLCVWEPRASVRTGGACTASGRWAPRAPRPGLRRSCRPIPAGRRTRPARCPCCRARRARRASWATTARGGCGRGTSRAARCAASPPPAG